MISSRTAFVSIASLALLACSDDHSHKHPHETEKAPAAATGAGHHSGKVIDLGAGVAGPFAVTATRDEGALEAGGEAPIDVRVTPANADAKVVAVRFWVGLESGVGSVKALAAIEDPAEPDRWHTHAEVPNPIPDGAKLWVEVEDGAAAKHVASFDLRK